MSEFSSESRQGQNRRNSVLIAAIIAGTIIVLAVILACAVTTYAFIANAPW
jgi:hypothetical protein